MRLGAIMVLLALVAEDARGDSLVIDYPDSVTTYEGVGGAVSGNSVYITVLQQSVQPTDGIQRSSFDTSYWYYQLIVDGALAEGSGHCALMRGAPDAYLRCDNR